MADDNKKSLARSQERLIRYLERLSGHTLSPADEERIRQEVSAQLARLVTAFNAASKYRELTRVISRSNLPVRSRNLL